jgi:pimeloyl-ACP methyl ester carboxylesterase
VKADFQRIEVAGVTLEVLRGGHGAPLLYLHDAGGIEASLPFIEQLQERFEVHAPSHPGFGGSELPQYISSVDDISYLYLDYLQQHALENTHLVGASFGGWIACEMAVKTTERLASLALIDALGVKFGSRDRQDIVDVFYLSPAQMREIGYIKPPAQAPDLAAARRIARNREALSLFGWSPLLHNPKLRHRLYRIGVPTLVLWGADDRVACVDYGRSYCAAIEGAEFALIARAGHLPHVEQPRATVDRLTQFLTRAPVCA